MFGWFKKKPEAPYDDRVWIDMDARLDALVREARAGGPLLILCFFPATESAAHAALAAGGVATSPLRHPTPWTGPVVVARADTLRDLLGGLPADLRVIYAEHHPLPAENRASLDDLAARTSARPVFFTALDEPLMKTFGGDRITALMVNLGMGRDEPVEHALVKQSLANAMEKIAAKVKVSRPAPSAVEWFERHL